MLLLTVIAWPTIALVRRHYGRATPLEGRALTLHRVSRGTALLFLVVAGMWMTFVSLLGVSLLYLDGRLDLWMRLAQILSVFAIVGAGLTCWNAWARIRGGRGWAAKAWSVALALACLFMAWFLIAMKLIPSSLNY